MSKKVYIELNKNGKVSDSVIKVADVADVHCDDNSIEAKIKAIKVLGGCRENAFYVINIVDVIKVIEDNLNNVSQAVEVNSVGETKCLIETDFLIEKKKSKISNDTKEFVKCAFVCLILFFGAGFSIMAFDNDISLDNLFNDFTKYLARGDKISKEILAASYGTGIFIGITVFYNHFNHKKFSKDPTPIEVEMQLYENDIVTTLTDRNEGK